MTSSDFSDLSPEKLENYINTHNEKNYLIIDVRTKMEYEEGHIPGAKLIPVMDLVKDLYSLPDDKDLIFYCRSGGRSVAAATLVSEEIQASERLYHLSDGLLGYEGKTLPGIPKIDIFKPSASPIDLLRQAMDLEKGALKFYEHAASLFSNEPFAPHFLTLSKAEKHHAQLLYNIWASLSKEPEDFETLFEKLDGQIVEGGDSITSILKQLMTFDRNVSIDVLEFALHVEYKAFDLYRTMAEKINDPPTQKAFITLSQAEKGHMKTLITALDESTS